MLDFSTHAKQRPDTRIFAFGLGETQDFAFPCCMPFQGTSGCWSGVELSIFYFHFVKNFKFYFYLLFLK